MNYSKRNIDTDIGTRSGAQLSYENPYGLMAQDSVEAKTTVTVDGKLVPFHAVDIAEVTESIIEAEKSNPHYCEPKGKVGFCKTCTGQVG